MTAKTAAWSAKTATWNRSCHKRRKSGVLAPKARPLRACQNKNRGDARDGYIRLRGGGRRLRRLHGGGTAVGGSGHFGGGAGRRRQERQLGGDDTVRPRAYGRRQRQQLGLQHRA